MARGAALGAGDLGLDGAGGAARVALPDRTRKLRRMDTLRAPRSAQKAGANSAFTLEPQRPLDLPRAWRRACEHALPLPALRRHAQGPGRQAARRRARRRWASS